MVKFFCVNNVTFPLFCCQHMPHKLCTQFLFFQIIRQNGMNDGFQYPRTLRYHPTTSTVIALQNSCLPSNVFVCFHCSRSSAPFCVFNRLFIRHKPACHRNIVARHTDESSNPFTNIFFVFTAINPALQQNFTAANCSKFFTMVIYNTSTELETYDIAKRSYTAAY